MRNQSWNRYWKDTDKSIIERQIQRYKAAHGYGKLLGAIPDLPPSGRVLEVGAGKAWISRLLRLRGWHTTAIDLDRDVVNKNMQYVDEYTCADIYHMPFSDQSFDLVISCGLIEHFTPDNVSRIINEMKRTGKMVIAWFPTCGAAWKTTWFLRNAIGGAPYIKTYRYGRKNIEDLFKSLEFRGVNSGFVSFAGILRYIYIYGHS